MNNNTIPYFVTANSADGFYNLLSTNIEDMKKIYVLSGDLSYIKYRIFKNLSCLLKNKGYTVECIHSSYEPKELDGIIIREEKMCILSDVILGSLSEIPYEEIHIYNTNTLLSKECQQKQKTIASLKKQKKSAFQKAYDIFQEAIHIHDEWERIYIQHMDLDRADEYTGNIIKMLLPKEPHKASGTIHHRFFGGATYEGSVDFVMQITKNLKKRYFIKGRPGSGKSTMMKKIALEAVDLGYEVDVYHCGFDPKSLDMVLIQPLNICIFDSTAPHEYFPESERDVIVDVYADLIEQGTDERYEKKLEDIISRYQEKVKYGTNFLKEGKQIEEQLKQIYIPFFCNAKYELLYDKLCTMLKQSLTI